MTHRAPASITDFLTDASLIQLCTALAQIARARVTVHDERGRRIVYTSGDPPWSLADDDEDAARIAEAMHALGPAAGAVPGDPRTVEPLIVAGRVIGAIVVEADPLRLTGAETDRLRVLVARLASTINEFCEQDVLIRQRNAELSVLFRLSSLLVAAWEIDEILNVALRSAAEILSADAGMIHLVTEDGGMALRAHTGLGEHFVERCAAEAPEGADLRALVTREGLAGIATGSLHFNAATLGRLHLFWRSAVFLEPDDQALLQTIIEQVSAAVAGARLIESDRRARETQRQLRLAADVQRRMLPRAMPRPPGLDLDARYIPTAELGGDFYDLIDLDGHLGVLVGDVAGKGVPAALLMAAVRASLRAHITDVYHLDEVMQRVNTAMARDTLPNEFATVFYGVIDPATFRLTYCNAGHDPPLLLRPPQGRPPADGDLFELDTGGMVVGVDESQRYQKGMFDLLPGDLLVAYTDGIIDARNFEGARFGRARLRAAILEVLRADPHASARAVADHIVWEVRRFIGLNPQADDETLVVMRVTPPPQPGPSER